MKFTIRREQLLKSINNVMNAISSRAAIPILTGIKINVEQKGITLTGSDSNISIESFIPTEENGMTYIEEIEEGSIVFQAEYFPEIVRKLPEQTVKFETDSLFNIKIRSGNAVFNLN